MKPFVDLQTFHETLTRAQEHLLELRGEQVHWEGELSSSALSTATAVCALDAYRGAARVERSAQQQLASLVQEGRRWLSENQNPDGGWGDTTLSFSNISTTALCWAALAGGQDQHSQAVAAAARWLETAAGSLEPGKLAEAIRRRYGRDRTFSVPILTTLALTGRLGPGREAWRDVPQLPFELAAFPHRWFGWMRLPVVSYALPALIAIGQVRHHHRPTRNPLMRTVRAAVKKRTLRVLDAIQPSSGGFLEATPLTSFVALSLVAAEANGVVQKAIEFIVRSVRPDGSWPIDTNLATWVTTLSVNGLSSATGVPPGEPVRIGVPAVPGGRDDLLTASEVASLRDWLVNQQYRVEHPYTHAAPGGWAWTDLPGGVPDADDTPGALLALKALDDGSDRVRQAAAAGVRWLLDLQNADGGMPTFCRGWGALPFDRSSPDLTAHAIRAWLAWREEMSPALQDEIRRAVSRAVVYLSRTQERGGAWAPLWFGNQHGPSEANLTYGTSRVLLALAALSGSGELSAPGGPDGALATKWLLSVQNEDGGWGGAAATPSSIEETALAVESLCGILADCPRDGNGKWLLAGDRQTVADAARRGVAWLIDHTDGGRHFPPSPIGFYFAKLWYFERLYPLIFTVAALNRAGSVSRWLFPAESVPAGADT